MACLKIQVVKVSCINMISRMVQFKLLCVPVRVFQECRSTDFFAKEAGYFWTLEKGRQNPEQGCRGTRTLDKGRQNPEQGCRGQNPSRGAEEPRTGVSKDPIHKGCQNPEQEPRRGVVMEPWTRVAGTLKKGAPQLP